MRPILGVDISRGSVIDPVGDKHLLGLHAAMDVDSFWKAVQQLLAAAIPNHLVGLALQHNPILPRITKWTSSAPDGFFAANPVKNYIAGPKHKKIVRISNLFSNRSSFVRSAFYRRYIAAEKCAHVVCLFFWKRQRLICTIVIMRTATQKQGRARLLCGLGKGPRGSAIDESGFIYSVRDRGSLPAAQTTMGSRAASPRSAQTFQRRTRVSSAIARSPRDRSPETAQLS